MSRQYRQPTAVAIDESGAPKRFAWRGRRYRVLAILLSWLETGKWWQSGNQSLQLWRVEATDEKHSGTYDLANADGRWFVRQIAD